MPGTPQPISPWTVTLCALVACTGALVACSGTSSLGRSDRFSSRLEDGGPSDAEEDASDSSEGCRSVRDSPATGTADAGLCFTVSDCPELDAPCEECSGTRWCPRAACEDHACVVLYCEHQSGSAQGRCLHTPPCLGEEPPGAQCSTDLDCPSLDAACDQCGESSRWCSTYVCGNGACAIAACHESELGPSWSCSWRPQPNDEVSTCLDERRALVAFIGDNKACRSDADCQSQGAGCGVTEDGCTGAVFFNRDADMARFEALRSALAVCTSGDPNLTACFACGRGVQPPVCFDDRCTNTRPNRDFAWPP